jgi:uncharacterized damage-inducible protein DinB
MNPDKRDYVVRPLPGCPLEIGRMLWQMEDTRRRTLRSLDNMPEGALDALPEGTTNTVGTLLYHTAQVEASWLYEDILEQPLPPDLAALLPFDHRDEQGILTKVKGFDLDWFLYRLDTVRGKLIEAYKAMSLEDFRRIHLQQVAEGSYDTTAEWVLHHLMQHEGEHRGHIQVLIEGLAKTGGGA